MLDGNGSNAPDSAKNTGGLRERRVESERGGKPMANVRYPFYTRRFVACSYSLVGVLLAIAPLASEAQQPTPQQQSAIRNSCRSDFQANCAGVQPGGAEALQCLRQNVAKVSPACQQALAPVMGSATPQASGAASASAPAGAAAGGAAASPKSPATAPAGQGGQMGGGQPPTMREELMLTRELCGAEFRSYCANVQLGGGRAIQCLEANATNLSARCKGALAQIRARR
jgi:hypothetical protein